MDTPSSNIIAIAIVSITVAMLVVPHAIARFYRLSPRDRLVKDAYKSFSQAGGRRRRYTSQEDKLIISKIISDDEMSAILQRSKNAIHVRRNALIDSQWNMLSNQN